MQGPGLRDFDLRFTTERGLMLERSSSGWQPGGIGDANWLVSLLRGWRERRHTARISRRLLEVYRRAAAAYPGLQRRALYLHIVIGYLGCAPSAADEVLESAEQSFAAWPVQRALTFRDVVHYLAVTEYTTTAGWTRENLGSVVASMVPKDL
jgi:hypothetical protein